MNKINCSEEKNEIYKNSSGEQETNKLLEFLHVYIQKVLTSVSNALYDPVQNIISVISTYIFYAYNVLTYFVSNRIVKFN